jgi:hypothetical protein
MCDILRICVPVSCIHVKPYDDGIRGTVRPMKAKLVKKDQYYIAKPTSMPGGGSASSISNTNLGVHNLDWVKGSVKSDGKVAELTWGYDIEFAVSMVDLGIYQKVDQSVTFTNPIFCKRSKLVN